MNLVKSNYRNRVEEGKKLFLHLSELSNNGGGVIETSILKSSYTLLLYNNLEATVSSSIAFIHDKASNYKYIDLSNELKKLYADYWHFDISKKKTKGNLDGTISGDLKFPNFENYSKRVTVFSGNIDLRSLNEINVSYGIGKVILREKNSTNILTIKNKRNKLAHGEESFKDSCRQYTLQELGELGLSLEAMLNRYIELVDLYIENDSYMASS